MDEIAAESRAAIEGADEMIENVAQPKPSEPESLEVILTRLGASSFDVEAIRAHADRQAAEIERWARIAELERLLELDADYGGSLVVRVRDRLAELKSKGGESE